MMGLRPLQGNLRLVFRLFSLMLSKPRIRLNNLKTSLRFPCRGLNPIIDSINLLDILKSSPYIIHISDNVKYLGPADDVDASRRYVCLFLVYMEF